MCMPKTPKLPPPKPPPPAAPPPPAPIEPELPPPPPEQVKQEAPTIKASASQKQSDQQATKGVSALTIPLSTGTKDQKSGLNIPT